MAKTNNKKAEAEAAIIETVKKQYKVCFESLSDSPYELRTDGTNHIVLNKETGNASEPLSSKRKVYAVGRRAKRECSDEWLQPEKVAEIVAEMAANVGTGRGGKSSSERIARQLDKAKQRREKLAGQLAELESSIAELEPALSEAIESEKAAAAAELEAIEQRRQELLEKTK